jgi:solute:Na+ symporter, SSS family
MHWIDWLIVAVPLLVVIIIGYKTQKYVHGVSDFLAAGRVAGRYVVAVSNGEAAMGLISLVAMFEMYYKSGFAIGFWNQINIPISLFLGLSGYCIYRFRETRSMTLGQFFEIRYSKSFRIFAATLQAVSGVVNYAIFPAVGARFLIYFCDLPLSVNIGGWIFPTFALVMLCFLSLAVMIVWFGGQITIMVTDCVQGILSYPMYVIIVAFILMTFSWGTQMAPTLLDRPAGTSMLNPYDIAKLRDFNLFYVMVGIFSSILNRMAWSGTQGYNAAAANPHEQKMGGVLGSWRAGFSVMMYILLAIAAYTFLNNADFSEKAQKVRNELAVKAMKDVAGDKQYSAVRTEIKGYIDTGKISPSLKARLEKENFKLLTPAQQAMGYTREKRTELLRMSKAALHTENKSKAQIYGTIYGQMLVPLSIREMLPIGVTGVFCAIMIFLLVSTDTTYMHSWGSIIVQDVILPFRTRPFTPRQQLTLLRIIIACVAVFAFCFSFFFGQVDYIIMFFVITGAIWLGGAGPCIVFGLYWKRGTTLGAFAALTSGSILAVGGFIAQKNWVNYIYPKLVAMEMVDSVQTILSTISAPFGSYIVWTVTPDKFPVNSMEIYFIALLTSLFLYVSLSLLTSKEAFNMDRMLHRGKYHREGEKSEKAPWSFKTFLPRLMGIDSQYTKWDKALAWSVFSYGLIYHFGAFVFIVVWNIFDPWPVSWWANWFLFNNLIVVGIIGIISTIWFSIGGTWDLLRLFKRLEAKETNLHDDGRVIGHVSSEDIEMVEKIDHIHIEDKK